MAESNITEEDMAQFGRVPDPTDAPIIQRQETSPGQERTRALNEALEYYTPPALRSRVEFFNEYLNPVTGLYEAGEDSKRAFDSELPVAERLKAAGSSLLNTGMSAIPIGLAAKKFLTPAQAVVDTFAGFGSTSPDVPTGVTDDLMRTVGDVTTPPREAPSRSLFREGDTRNVADFYSPARELLDYTQYPNKGLKGSEAIKLLRNAPDVRQAEIDLLDINPQTRYNREELLDLVNNNTYTVTAERPTELDWQGRYQNYETQRQELKPSVEELDYQETILRAQRPSSSFRASEGTHHTKDTIAHLRTSRQQNMETGDRFYLIEEIQSDLVSRGASPTRGPVSYDEAVSENADKAFNQLKADEDFKTVIETNREFLKDYFANRVAYSSSDLKDRFSADPIKSFVEKYNIQNDSESASDYLIDRGVRPDIAYQLVSHVVGDAGNLAFKSPESLTEAVGGAPIKDINEVVRLGLQTAISDALANGDTKVVIPNLDRIVSAGRARPGTKDYENMTAPGSSFHRMYVTGLNKAISELQKDLPDLTVGSMDVPYNRYPDLPSAATVLDLSAYSDKNLNTLRFAEGGLATERQMNRLMADGGLSDDGINMDPVSGNEVPPGSMAEEVRDDIPAQLSGGEYVVPADVVRYYGVRFFEDLRGEAKGGLSQMEEEGRIGGEPIPQDDVGAGAPSLSEEDMAMLQAIASQQGGPVGMAEGGMAQQNTMMGGDQLIDNIINVAKSDPTLMSKLNSKGVMLAEGGLLTGYADGGLLTGYAEGGFTPSFDPSDWTTIGGSYFDDTGQTGPIENRTYRGPNGETITVRFQNGTAMDPIPQGYVLESEYSAPEGLGGGDTPSSSGTYASRQRDKSETPLAPTVSSEPDDPSKYRGVDFSDPFGAAQEAISASQGNLTGRLASAVASSINPALGAAVKQGIVMNGLANARANLEVAKRQGNDEAVTKIESLLAEREKSLGMARGAISDLIASGEGIANNAWNQFTDYGLTGAATPTEAIQKAVSGVKSSGTSSTTSGVSYKSDSKDGGDSYGVKVATGSTAPTSSVRPVARPSGGNKDSNTASSTGSSYVDRSPVSSGSGASTTSAYKSDGTVSTSGRATGGLMGKPKKL